MKKNKGKKIRKGEKDMGKSDLLGGGKAKEGKIVHSQ